eukprot:COSAG01_NODE_5795_length_4031_cov_2.927263_6_plen_47_part_00
MGRSLPDFHVSDLEKHDFLDFDTDDNGEFILSFDAGTSLARGGGVG